MQVLLDSHVLLWWVLQHDRLSRAARETIEDRQNQVFVSAASAWEIATKYRIGRLEEAGPLAVHFSREIHNEGFSSLPISVEHGQVAGSLRDHHNDPFDRILIAQAREEKMALVSNEKLFDRFDIVRIW
ncbi:MAG: type II toxin-antitoxin system VapC family toxin [Gemmatimonadaceae bacterium]